MVQREKGENRRGIREEDINRPPFPFLLLPLRLLKISNSLALGVEENMSDQSLKNLYNGIST